MNRLLSVLGLLLTLIVSVLLDRAYSLLKTAGMDQPETGFMDMNALRIRLAGDIFANLILVVAVIGLGWWVLIKTDKDPLVAWLFTGAGIIAMLYLPLVLTGPDGMVAFLTSSPFGLVTRGFRMALMDKGFTTYFGIAGAGVFVVGVLAFFKKGSKLGGAKME